MQNNNTSKQFSERLKIVYTDKPVSGWGGLAVAIRFIDRLGVRDLLRRALPDGRTSPNQIPVVNMVLALFVSVLTGGRRFAHVERVRSDDVVKGILGIERMPSSMTLTRYFGGFLRQQVEHLVETLWTFTLSCLRPTRLGMVLDVDSTVFERYGNQEGSLKGHNPRKHGRPSHHPLIAILAEAKIILHAWLRSGNTGSARGVVEFLNEALARLPKPVQLYALRADSGFFVNAFLDALEKRGLPYVIPVRMYKHFQREVARIRAWTPFAPGLEAGEIFYKAPSWKTARRLVAVREELAERPEARGRMLFDVPGYKYHVLVTTMKLKPIETWRFYNARADSENRLKELKEDFGANGFCLQSFDGTEAVFRLICFLFNLLALFKRDVLTNEAPRLNTVRTEVFVTGGLLGREGHHTVLRLGLKSPWRERFEVLLQRVAMLSLATVAQLEHRSEALVFSSRWQPRRRHKRSVWWWASLR